MEENKTIDKNEAVDIISLIRTLCRNWRFILCVSCVGACVGLIIGFSLPKVYEAKVAFAPETEQKLGSGVSSIASMMGVSLDNSIDAISVDMFPDVVASTPFIFNLFDVEVQSYDGKINTTLVDYLLEYQKKPWWSHVLGFPFKLLGDIVDSSDGDTASDSLSVFDLPKKYRNVVGYFRKNLKVSQDNKSGKTMISLTMQDPLIAADVLKVVVDNLKTYMSDYRTSKDRQDVENLTRIFNQRKEEYYATQVAYADFADKNKGLVKLKSQAEQLRLQQDMNLAYQVYSQVATQLEGARIKEQQAKPVFVILEPVTLPLKKFPSKAKMMVSFFAISCFFAVFWVLLGRKYYEILKRSMNK